MSLFSKLFGSPTEREIRRKFNTMHNDVELRTSTLGAIGVAIVKASNSCFEQMKPFINNTDHKKRQKLEVYLFFEFLYFFMHLTIRYAFSQLNEKQISKLQRYLGPMIVVTAIDTFFMHWPDDLKQKLRSEFYDKLNEAELDYSSSKELMSKNKPFTGDSLISKLARNVGQLIGDDMNPGTMMAAVDASTSALIEAKLDALVAKAATALKTD
jgi:hypothetical protein